MTAQEIIERLSLSPHPEGGYYRETYRSQEIFTQEQLPGRYTGDRSLATCIYFLLAGNEFSAFHRIQSDETWHHYHGQALHIYCISPGGNFIEKLLGPALHQGQEPQFTVPAGYWFAARVKGHSGFSLIGCTVAPGFDFSDFEMGKKSVLIKEYPQHSEILSSLCKE
jgi:predicted cupin superfamily sugar epimerase